MCANIHDGHRKRMREKFYKNGLEAFTDIEALEMLLFYAVPYRETNTLAHALLDKFGSLENVMAADYNHLIQVDGIGDNTASIIKFVPEFMRRLQINIGSKVKVLNSVENAASVIKPYLSGKKIEELYMFCLTTKKTLIRVVPLQKGTVDSVQIYTRHILSEALMNNAHSIILAHNHPSGSKEPSKEDIEKTILIEKTLRGVNIELADHFIIADNDFASLKRMRVINTVPMEEVINKEKVEPYLD